MELPKRSLKKTREILLQSVPEITAIFKDFEAIRKKFGVETEDGAGVIEEFLDMLLTRHYDGVLKVLAQFYKTTPSKIENLEDDNEVFDMVLELLKTDSLTRFFPRLRLSVRRMQLDI